MASLQAPKSAWQLRVYPFFSLLGWVLIGLSLIIGLVVLAPTASSYWGESAKAVRDAAEVGTTLLGQLQTLNTTPRWLEPLTFLGVASFMFGIALEFSSIPNLLKNRGQVMSVCFPVIAKQGSE
jgi:hypothetical protein